MQEQIRFAVVLNGGVSSAVWMGGVVLEIDNMTRGGSGYWPLMDALGIRSRADVVVGTSAGGINGAALALAQVNRRADLAQLRDLWVDQGHMEDMLRTPFQGDPTSLLKGDDYVLPRVREALRRLSADFDPTPGHERPVDLRITTTLLPGVPWRVDDDLGTSGPVSANQGSFRFRRDAERDDFSRLDMPALVERLALAARASAAIPIAFEPAFIPVGEHSGRPDMASVASWAVEADDRSRYGLDGGLLVNAPVHEVLTAIDHMPAEGPVRRVVLMVSPHAAADGARVAALDEPPGTFAAAAELLAATTNESEAVFMRGVREHNLRATGLRDERAAILAEVASGGRSPERLYEMATDLYWWYRTVRIRHSARSIAAARGNSPDPAGWTFERARTAAHDVQREWEGTLPYLPAEPPPNALPDRGWPWGASTPMRLVAAATDLLTSLATVAMSEAVARARTDLQSVKAEVDHLLATLVDHWHTRDQDAPDQSHWRERLHAYSDLMLSGKAGSPGTLLRERMGRLGEILAEARSVLDGVDDHRLRLGGLTGWRALLAPGRTDTERAAGLAAGPDTWLSRLLALDVVTLCLQEEPDATGGGPVELVRLNLWTRHGFAAHSVGPEEKIGSPSLSRLSGFLQRSWRVNDWIWGRLDGATTLCRVLCNPERLRALDHLGGVTDLPPAARADRYVDHLVEQLFGGPVPELASLIASAKAEVRLIYESDPQEKLPPVAAELAELAAWGLHVRIITEEIPALRQAIIADRGEGGRRNTRGELFLETHAQLLAGLETIDPAGSRTAVATAGVRALRAFDRAGVNREPLVEEVRSDQVIRMAVTAGAVAMTMADSENSGLAAAKPLTRALRGAALLPYWTINRLTSGRKWAHLVGLADLVVSGGLLVLALFNLLPAAVTGPAAAIGGAWLLAALGYSALRTGTLLHGLVLLSPVLPLIGVAVARAQSTVATPASKDTATTGVIAVGGVALVVLALIVLGSLPTPVASPLTVLGRVRLGYSRLRSLLVRVALVAVAVAGVWVVVRYRASALDSFAPSPVLTLAVSATALVFGFVVAFVGGASLRRWRMVDGVWETEGNAPPAAVTAGWAVVYGSVYLLVADLLLVFRVRFPGWQAVLGVALVFAVMLLLVVPWLVPLQARSRIVRSIVDDWPARRPIYGADDLLDWLRGRAELYHFLVGVGPDGQLVATKATVRCTREIIGRVMIVDPS